MDNSRNGSSVSRGFSLGFGFAFGCLAAIVVLALAVLFLHDLGRADLKKRLKENPPAVPVP